MDKFFCKCCRKKKKPITLKHLPLTSKVSTENKYTTNSFFEMKKGFSIVKLHSKPISRNNGCFKDDESKAGFSSISHSILQLQDQEKDTCELENWKFHPNPAIIGLNSTFINSNLIVSQRPGARLIKQYNITDSFKRMNIKLIINLQNKGEDHECSQDKATIDQTGYAYNPDEFIERGIEVLLFGWESVKSTKAFRKILELVKKIWKAIHIEKVNVLIHCHSGYDRCPILAICYLIYESNMEYNDIIQYIDSRCPLNQENRFSLMFTFTFRVEYNKLKCLFAETKRTIEIFMKNQQDLFVEQVTFKFSSPVLFTECLEKIIELKNAQKFTNSEVCELMTVSSSEFNPNMLALKKTLNDGRWNLFSKCENISLIIELLKDWLRHHLLYLINPTKISKLCRNGNFHKLYNRAFNEHFSVFYCNLLVNELKTEFKNYEYESLYNLANFLISIYPDSPKFLYSYELIIFEFSTELLGFRELTLNYTPQRKLTTIKFLDKLIHIFIILQLPVKEKTENATMEQVSTSNLLPNATCKIKQNLNHSIDKTESVSPLKNNKYEMSPCLSYMEYRRNKLEPQKIAKKVNLKVKEIFQYSKDKSNKNIFTLAPTENSRYEKDNSEIGDFEHLSDMEDDSKIRLTHLQLLKLEKSIARRNFSQECFMSRSNSFDDSPKIKRYAFPKSNLSQNTFGLASLKQKPIPVIFRKSILFKELSLKQNGHAKFNFMTPSPLKEIEKFGKERALSENLIAKRNNSKVSVLDKLSGFLLEENEHLSNYSEKMNSSLDSSKY